MTTLQECTEYLFESIHKSLDVYKNGEKVYYIEDDIIKYGTLVSQFDDKIKFSTKDGVKVLKKDNTFKLNGELMKNGIDEISVIDFYMDKKNEKYLNPTIKSKSKSETKDLFTRCFSACPNSNLGNVDKNIRKNCEHHFKITELSSNALIDYSRDYNNYYNTSILPDNGSNIKKKRSEEIEGDT
jgi:hypothetical protein